MNTIVNSLLPVIGKHWLRIGVLVVFLFVLNQKQINLSLQLGKPAVPVQQQTPATPDNGESRAPLPPEKTVLTDAATKKGGSWLQQLNVFSAPAGYPDLTVQLQQVDQRVINAFIKRFADVARTEQQKFGIPASITLANALLQSAAGTTGATTKANNIFGLPCTTDWVGPTYLHPEGERCYRRYENAWTSFRDHSLYLTSGAYTDLTALSSQDYTSWAAGLEARSYNYTEDLAQQLLGLIEEWQLFQYD